MTRHVLLVCSANVCRSPSAEHLLQRRLRGSVDSEGHDWVVHSAGTSITDAAIDPNTRRAAALFGFDLGDHVARTLDASILAVEGRDLVLTMTREHVREVVALDPGAWPRTFTLKEIVRRASSTSAERAEDPAVWLHRLAAGRRAADMVRPDPIDDIEDPYGHPLREHRDMMATVDELADRLVRLGPWLRRTARV